jgi:hypothetical protein
MGIKLVNGVLANHAGLSDRAFRVLIRMCATALDEPSKKNQPPFLYWGGWELLAMALARDVPPADAHDPASRKARERAKETVRRAVAELVKAKLVDPLGSPCTGSRQTYRLHIAGVSHQSAASVDEIGGNEVGQTGEGHRHGAPPSAARVPQSGEEGHRHGGDWGTATVPPRSSEEQEFQDLLQDINGRPSTATTDRARGRATRTSRRTGSIDWDAAYARAAARDRAAAGGGVGVEWANGGHPFTPSSRRPSASGHRLCVCGEPADAERHREVG